MSTKVEGNKRFSPSLSAVGLMLALNLAYTTFLGTGRQQGYFCGGFNLVEVLPSDVLVLSGYCTGIVLCVKMRPKNYAVKLILKT